MSLCSHRRSVSPKTLMSQYVTVLPEAHAPLANAERAQPAGMPYRGMNRNHHDKEQNH